MVDTFLGSANTFFDGIDEVGLAGTDVGSEDVRAVTYKHQALATNIAVEENSTYIRRAREL